MSSERGRSSEQPVIEGAPVVNPTGAVSATSIQGGVVDEDRSLETEIAYYLSHLPEWHEHQGQYVLIRGAELYGFYLTDNDALAEGFRRFGRVSFLVKQVDLDEKPRPRAWVIL